MTRVAALVGAAGPPLDANRLKGLLAEAMAPYDIPFDMAVVAPPVFLERRHRPYAIAMPHLGGEPWTKGYDDLAAFKALIVVVLFTDVAADYFIRRDLMPRFRNRIEIDQGAGTVGSDDYLIARKELAALARLGRIGRNSLFFSRRFGFECKIDVVCLTVDVRGMNTVLQVPPAVRLGACLGCDLCVTACPVSAYADFAMINSVACEKHITPDWDTPERMCRACIESCPASNRMLARCHADHPAPFSIFESTRRASAMFRRIGDIAVDVSAAGVILRGDSFEIAFAPDFARACAFIAARQGLFSKVALARAAPELSDRARDRLLGVLRDVGAIAPF